MPSDHADRFRLRHHGTLIEVEIEPKFLEPKARLLIDGDIVDEQSTWPEQTTLQGPGLDVGVQWSVLLRPQRAWAMFDDDQGQHGEGDETEETRLEHDLTPPAGSWAERVTTFANRHPNIYASRHVVKATAQALIGLIGIGAILWGLLPRFDIDIPFPDINVGNWLRSIIPGWIRDVLNLPGRIIVWMFGWVTDITIVDRIIDWIRASNFPPDWLQPIVSSTRYWVPILIALLVAIEEVNRRNKKRGEGSPDASADAEKEIPETDQHGNNGGSLVHEDTPDTPVNDDAARERPDVHNDTDTSP